MSKAYIALIADAVASRRLPPPARARLQARLRAALPAYTRRWRRHVAAAFGVALGDEVQGLLSAAEPLWEITHRLRLDFPEVEWVIACGRGALATPPPPLSHGGPPPLSSTGRASTPPAAPSRRRSATGSS
ncbi:MAG TPA: SatD family protein [Gemmatimonadales bacterium]|nr:SatD family protein [Gemmatimonadales bacterium]